MADIPIKEYIDALMRQSEHHFCQRLDDKDKAIAIALAAQEKAQDRAIRTVLLIISLMGGAGIIIGMLAK